MAPSVSVVVPARNAAATLPATLSALAAQEGVTGDVEVVVVDDGSADATARVAAAAGAVVVPGPGDGPAAARNLGASRATGAVLAFTDADCEPSPQWLAAALEALRDADLVQGAVAPVPGVVVGPFDRTLRVPAQTGLYESANLVVRRETFEALGGFESWLRPRRGLELGEDVWFGWKARRSGARVVFSHAALVHHAVFARGIGAFVWERARLRFFPDLARRVPELRRSVFFGRVFLTRRTATFDAAVAGLLLARRRRWAVLAALPYARQVLSDRRYNGGRFALASVAADAVGLAALLVGSARTRTPVL